MFPFIIHHGAIVIPTFFFMVMVASLSAALYLYRRAPRVGFSQVVILDIALLGTFFGIIGARLFHVFAEAPWYYREDPIRVLYFWQGGFVGYGVFFGILFSAILYLKLRKLPILPYADFIALACPLIIFFVRIGCIGAGCCYGKPTDFFLHLTFIHPSSDGGRDFPGVALHATQIYDLLNAVAVFAVIHWLYPRKRFHGQVLLVFFMLYGLIRGLIEFLRGDLDRGVYFDGMFSTSQAVGIVILIFGGWLWFLWSRRYPVVRNSAS